jgi:HTH-type transcriptional regulator, transcriptional repressor of NAD biosynthesis genes
MTRGLIIGKFYPPHLGHSHLIATALTHVDHLIVLVCHKPEQRIAGETRAQWLREMHPNADVRVIPDAGRDDDSKFWAEETIRFLGFVPDVVFTSESYGDAFARFLGCKHVSVDPFRTAVPISATQIRQDPLAHWQFLPGPVRAALIPRVCVVGAESTGSTTLAQALARHYQTAWVPEFGRTHTEGRMYLPPNTHWTSREFLFIAEMQNRFEDELARVANRILICDTDSFATCIWEERYLGLQSPNVVAAASGRRMDFYLLTDVNIPFVQDGIRDGEHIRASMHARFIEELRRLGKPFRILSGVHEARLAAAIEECDAVMKRLKNRFDAPGSG